VAVPTPWVMVVLEGQLQEVLSTFLALRVDLVLVHLMGVLVAVPQWVVLVGKALPVRVVQVLVRVPPVLVGAAALLALVAQVVLDKSIFTSKKIKNERVCTYPRWIGS
jgi:hypothetical protein